MAYKYDVFISYKRKHPYGKWVNEIFIPHFKPYLEEELCTDKLNIFIDVKEIESGQAWDLRIKDALIHSRVMVSILIPTYFESEWCKKEFAFIDYRQKECGFMQNDNYNGLIIPLKISDGDSFPEYVNKRIQIANFNDYSNLGLEYAPKYGDFQTELKEWVKHVANAHKNAPDWDDKWREPEWVERSLNNTEHLKSIKSNKPPML